MVQFPIVHSSQRAVIAINIIFLILPTVAVALRLWTRQKRRIALDASDILIVVALFISLIFTSLGLVMVYNCGISFVAADVEAKYGKEPLVLFAQIIVIMEFCWALSITCIKLSILIFYAKIFSVPTFVLAARLAAGLVVAWCIGVCMTDFLICRPFAFNWDTSIKGGYCGNTILGFQLLGTMNLLTDLVIIVLPQPYIWSLHLPMAKRIALAITFVVGVGASIFTILRITSLNSITATNELQLMPKPLLWGELEPAIGILVACAPMLRILIFRDMSSRSNNSNSYDKSNNAYNSGSGAMQSKLRRQDFGKLDEQEYPLRSVDTKTGPSSFSCASVEDVEMNGISGDTNHQILPESMVVVRK